MKINIISVNFFGEQSGSTEWNARVVYKKYNKSYNCLVFIDFFNKNVFVSKEQFKECKALNGIAEAVKAYQKF